MELNININPFDKKVSVNLGDQKGETTLGDMIQSNTLLTVENVEAFVFQALMSLGISKEEFIAALEIHRDKTVENTDDLISRLE